MNSALLEAADRAWTENRLFNPIGDRVGEPRASRPRMLPRFPLTRLRAIEPDLHGRYLVKGLLPRAALAVVWGAPKCGKSFWALDLVAHIACGAPYRALKVKQGAVVYIAAEGADGFKARARAWCGRHLAAEDDPPLHVLTMRLELVKDHAALAADIQAQLGKVRPAVVVFDTVNRTYTGSESSDQDMTAYVNAADAIKTAFDCLVMLIHHCGVEGTRPRGHTALAGAADVQISIRKDAAGLIVARVDWAKDMPDGYCNASRLEAVTIGTDEDGDPITTCVVVPSDDAPLPPRGPKLTAMQATALKALDNALADAGQMRTLPGMPDGGAASVPTEVWRQAFYRISLLDAPDGNQSARQKAFRRASMDLQARELVGCASEHVWKVRGR
jgi:hypothetical protein